MKIKTATRIAIYGVAVGTIMNFAAPAIFETLQISGVQYAVLKPYWKIYEIIEAVARSGGLLVFLCVLASNQKD